jgi:hypothetical protein
MATKKDELKRELAWGLWVEHGLRIALVDVLDRNEAAEVAGYHPNHWTNGFANGPNYYLAPPEKFGPNGLMLFLRSHVERRGEWQSENLGWPDARKPTGDDVMKLWGDGSR